jgi:hypothetical protein
MDFSRASEIETLLSDAVGKIHTGTADRDLRQIADTIDCLRKLFHTLALARMPKEG